MPTFRVIFFSGQFSGEGPKSPKTKKRKATDDKRTPTDVKRKTTDVNDIKSQIEALRGSDPVNVFPTVRWSSHFQGTLSSALRASRLVIASHEMLEGLARNG